MVQNDGMLEKFASIFGGPMSPALDEVVHTSHAVVCLSRTPDKPIEKRGQEFRSILADPAGVVYCSFLDSQVKISDDICSTVQPNTIRYSNYM